MKRIILILVIVLVVVYAGLSVLSNSKEYSAEKLLFRAGKDKVKLGMNPDVEPPAMVASLENNLRAVMDEYPATDAAKTAQFGLVEHYIKHKEYDKAIGIIDGILVDVPEGAADISAKLHFVKGNIYEEQEKLDKALDEYLLIKDKYLQTRMGLQMPVYIGNFYLKHKMAEKAMAAFNEAASMYKERAEQARGQVMGYVMSTLLAQVYAGSERYEEAAVVIEDIINTYPAPLTYMQHLPNVDFVFVRKLNRPEKAIEIYESVKTKIPDGKLKNMLDERIKALKDEIGRAADGSSTPSDISSSVAASPSAPPLDSDVSPEETVIDTP